jgi:hypothetical protein
MSLRIAFDLDGTVADMYDALYKEAEKLFGEEVLAKARYKPAPPPPADDGTPPEKADEAPGGAATAMEELRLTARQQMRLWDHVKKIENFWTTLPELEPGIIARIAKTAAERRWDVLFITTRPSTAGETTQLQSQRWLDAHGFRYPSVYVVQRSRGRIADALHLDMVVDDRPENCLDVAVESKAKVILVWHGHMSDVPPGAARMGVRAVSTISEAVQLAEQYDDLRNQPSMMKSIRKMMGRE